MQEVGLWPVSPNPRIPESEIERLKAEVSLERLAEARGVALKRHGADLLGLCPFHDDREPSLVISPVLILSRVKCTAPLRRAALDRPARGR